MTSNAIFIDTWAWVTMSSNREPRFHEILAFYQEVGKRTIPLYTSDYVLDEFISLIFSREPYNHARGFVEALFASAEAKRLQIERIDAARFLAAWELRKRYQDKPRISFTDLTSMVIMKELDITQVLTEDEHFMHVGLGFIRVPQT